MANNLALTVTGSDGTVYAITGTLTGANVVKTSPVAVPPPAVPPVIPATALILNALPMTGWEMNHDAGTSGSSVGTTSYPVTAPDGTANCRLFDFTNTAGGGEIYHFPVLADCTPYKNFCFKFKRMTPNPLTVTNSEHDMEAVDASGNVLDMATQEDGYNGVFDVTENHKWVATGIKVNPTTWLPNSWHDDEIYLIDNGDGTVTYPGVKLDGVFYPLNVTSPDVDASKWAAKILNLQIQFDTKSTLATESKVYCSQCEVDCW
jgi:hypothetical protein